MRQHEDTTGLLKVGQLRALLVLLGIAVGLWLLVALLVAPWVIDHAYRGDSLPILNRLFEGRHLHPLGHYLQAWHHQVTIPGLLVCVGAWLVLLVVSRPAFFHRCVGEATPGSLGAIRMLTCTILLLSILWEHFSSIAVLPPEIRRPMGIMRVLDVLPIGFERLVTSETSLRLFQWFAAVLLFLGAIGWRTRLVIPLGALCFLVFGGILRQYSFFWHQHLVPLYVMAVLSWTPCGDGWSVDRLRKIAQGTPVPLADAATARYGWCRYACWVAVALPYVAAGLSKLRNVGPFWWTATNMRRIFYTDTLNPMQFDWQVSLSLAHAPDVVFTLFGLAGVFGEVCYGLVLFSRTARWICPITMGLMHVGIMFLQNILFIDLIFLQLIFFDFTKLRHAIGRWLAARRVRIQGLYEREEGAMVSPALRPTENPQRLRYPLAVSALGVAMLLCWAYRIESYPLTGMPMYTGPWWRRSGEITYYKALAHRESGRASKGYFDKAVGILALNGRYRPLIRACFSTPDKAALCKKVLAACGAAYNKKARPGERLTQFELQQWTCDPADPEHGTLAARVILEIPGEPPRSTRAQQIDGALAQGI